MCWMMSSIIASEAGVVSDSEPIVRVKGDILTSKRRRLNRNL